MYSNCFLVIFRQTIAIYGNSGLTVSFFATDMIVFRYFAASEAAFPSFEAYDAIKKADAEDII